MFIDVYAWAGCLGMFIDVYASLWMVTRMKVLWMFLDVDECLWKVVDYS